MPNRAAKFMLAVLLAIVQSITVAAASEPSPAPAPREQSLPAVDGINGKLVFGGAVDGTDTYAVGGAIAIPLGHAFGLQIDAGAGELDSYEFGDIPVYLGAAHLFWRDPATGLVGIYGDYVHVDYAGGLNFYTAAVEGGLYVDRFTVDGRIGVKGGDVIDTDFFDQLNLLYYPLDNLNIRIGHSYAFENHSFLYGAEWAFGSANGAATSLFVAGRLAEGGSSKTFAGLRLYLGQSDKSLIRRHREDDPASDMTYDFDYDSDIKLIPPQTLDP